MKCSNPDCNRRIGLVRYRRWFSNNVMSCVPRRLQEERNATTYFEWLFLQPIKKDQFKTVPAVIRPPAR